MYRPKLRLDPLKGPPREGLPMRDPQSITVNEDERLIPVWSIVAAVAAFVLVEYYFWLVLPRPDTPSAATRLSHLLQPVLGCAGRSLLPHGRLCQQGCAPPRHELALLDRDLLCHAGRHRRGALLPAAPAEVSRCPACSTHVQSDFHFCPQCDFQLAASCGNCFRTVRATDQFCTRCGHELAADHMPARLRVLGE